MRRVLFYRDGFHAVGLDRIIADVGVTKTIRGAREPRRTSVSRAFRLLSARP